jgi:hypothetical protein
MTGNGGKGVADDARGFFFYRGLVRVEHRRLAANVVWLGGKTKPGLPGDRLFRGAGYYLAVGQYLNVQDI